MHRGLQVCQTIHGMQTLFLQRSEGMCTGQHEGPSPERITSWLKKLIPICSCVVLGSLWAVDSHFVFGFLRWYLSLVFRPASIFAYFTCQQFTPSQAKGLLNSSNRSKIHHQLRCGAKEKQRRDLLIFLPLWEELNWAQNWTRCPDPLDFNRTAWAACHFPRVHSALSPKYICISFFQGSRSRFSPGRLCLPCLFP